MKSIGEQMRSSVSFLSFQGSDPDFELMKEVYHALQEFTESKKCEKINSVAWKIDYEYNASRDFSFIKKDRLKFVCSILLNLFSSFYRSKNNKHGDVLLKLMKMMIEESIKEEIDEVMNELKMTYYWNDEMMEYYNVCSKTLNMTDEDFVKLDMNDMGFSISDSDTSSG